MNIEKRILRLERAIRLTEGVLSSSTEFEKKFRSWELRKYRNDLDELRGESIC